MLKVWLPLDGDLRNQGISDAIATNNGATVDNNGKIGKCYNFAKNAYLDINKETMQYFSNAISICFWIKVNSWNTNWDTIFQAGKGGAAWTQYHIGILRNSANYLCWTLGDGSTASNANYQTGNITVGQWTHIVCTYEEGQWATYLNGTLSKSGTTTIVPNFSNITSIKIGGLAGAYKCDCFLNDFRIYDHCLSAAEVKEIAQGLVLHYPLNRQSLKPIGTNLVTGITKGGQTSLLTDGRVGVVTSGTNADTYFTINLSESITSGTTYYFSCDVSGVSEDQYWSFPLGAQSNTSMPSKFYNGHNEYIFTANDINWGTNRLFLDDNYRNDYAHPASFYNFVLIKNPTFVAGDGSGFRHNGTSNAPITTSEDTSRYEEASYFGAYNTPVLMVDNFSSIAPALTSCTITWWGKYDTSKTLLLTGQSTSHYIGASNNNNYYHGNAGSPIMYKDGVSGTYKCAADGWHFFALTGVNISTWTTLKINGYGSGWPLNGYISDFRIYCTPLLDTDIKQLYNIGMKVDKQGNIHSFSFKEQNGKTEFKKTGIVCAYDLNDNKYYDNIGHIGKKSYQDILNSNYYAISTKNSHYTFGSVPSIPAATITALAGKTLKLSYDVCTLGPRLSTENGDTAWNKIRYGIHGSMSYTNASGTSGTSYPFAGYLEYSGDKKHVEQTWTIPTGYQTYGALEWGVQPYDRPASTNNNTWFISNIKLEVISDPSPGGWISGTQLIER